MEKILDRFLRYVSLDTQSEDDRDVVPSTEKQLVLARLLKKELEEMGAENVTLSEHGYVYASIPATVKGKVPALGFIAHMDTAPAMPGYPVKPRIVQNYDGGDIILNDEKNVVMRRSEFDFLGECIGRDLIVTDGTTLLGADDKAGVAEIMTMAEILLSDSSIAHGEIRIGFTPDEEVGRGADYFDVEGFDAAAAYTVDGGALGELEYENFNAASGHVFIRGNNIHPGSAKNKMINAVLVGMEFQSLLPVAENPMYTEGYEGFFHLDRFEGNVESVRMEYIIRDHDREKFERKKELFGKAAAFINEKYGEGTLTVSLKDSYYNMKEKIEPSQYLIDIAKEAMLAAGVTPSVLPIRGGTDGARLSYMGLPCPNLCTGGYNFHGKYECIPVDALEKTAEILLEIAGRFFTHHKDAHKKKTF